MAQTWYEKVGEDGIYRHYPGFLRLFRYEFDILCGDAAFVKEYRRNLKKSMSPECVEDMERLIPETQISFTKTAAKDESRIMFFGLRYVKDEDHEFWKWFHQKLINLVKDRQDCRLVMLKTAPKYEKEYFDIFFDNSRVPNLLDHVTDVLMINEFIEEFQKLHVPAYDQLLKDWVIPVNEKHPRSFHYGSCVLMRQLFYCKPENVAEKEHSWYHDFLYTCTKNVRNGTILKYIDNEYHIKLDSYVTKLNATTKLGLFDSSEFVDPEEEKTIQFRPPKSCNEYFSIDPDVEGATLELRNYQRELVRFAKEGISTVICAPTGSGKTIVAIDIIRNHLFRRNISQDGSITERSRVVFLVPTVPLVDQQTKLIKTYLGERYTINGFSGGDHRDLNKRASDILKSQIIIITPQMLVNLLQTVQKNRRLYISDFTLFVLDECHHCGSTRGSKHPYEILMKMVRRFVEENLNGRDKPQVVGLTASLGTDREIWNPTIVNDHMLALCVRMLATQVSTVRSSNNITELNHHVSPPIDEICPMRRAKKDSFRDVLCEIVSKIVEIIRPDVEELVQSVDKLKDFRFTNPNDAGFRNIIERLYESKLSWPSSFENRVKIETAIEHFRIYLYALKYNELLPSMFAFVYIKDKFDAKFAKTNNDEFCQLYNQFKDKLEEVSSKDNGKNKPILEKLKSIIETAYEENPNTRTIIFAESRCLTQFLAEYLNRCKQLERFATDGQFAHYLTSTNQARKHGGMSSADQKNILNAFDHGNVKVLVATSVGEEGLDISACNLIIKYNTVGSERTMIQRRGRARAKNSKSYLICLDGDVEQREIDNITRELLMHKCLQHIQAMSPKQLEDAIEEQRIKMRSKETVIADEEKERNRVLADNVYELQCSKCFHPFCDSNSIRSVLDPHYCCVQKEIWNNIKIIHTDSSSRDNNFIKCNPFQCIKCDNVLGTVVIYAEVSLPSIKSSAIVIQEKVNKNSGRTPDKIGQLNWTKMQQGYFLVNPITQDNLIEMADSLRSASEEDYEQVKLQASYAIQRQIEKIKAKRMRKNLHMLAEYGEDDF